MSLVYPYNRRFYDTFAGGLVYLLRSPANANRLFSALEWAKSTQSPPQTLAQLREELAIEP
jgi:hypothetical protein